MKYSNFCLLFFVFIIACGPKRSEVIEEVVNPSLVQTLIKSADSTIEIKPDSLSFMKNPLLVRGLKLLYKNKNATTTLWFDEKDQLMGMLEYENEVMQDSILFYPNGQRMINLTINKNGYPEGTARYFYPDGRVKMDGKFENGIQTGIWREFSPDGRLLITREYDRYGKAKR